MRTARFSSDDWIVCLEKNVESGKYHYRRAGLKLIYYGKIVVPILLWVSIINSLTNVKSTHLYIKVLNNYFHNGGVSSFSVSLQL